MDQGGQGSNDKVKTTNDIILMVLTVLPMSAEEKSHDVASFNKV